MQMEQADNELYVRKALSKFACKLDTVFYTKNMIQKTVTSRRSQLSICLTL